MESIRVCAPATSANLGSGFDVCGLALAQPFDEFEFSKSDAWTAFNSRIHEAATDAERSVFAFVWKAMQKEFELEGSLRVEAKKGIKPRAGLGASAAEASACAFAVNELFGLGLTKEELVFWAGQGEAFSAGEAHYDNVAPCVFGGFTVVYDQSPLRVRKKSAPKMSCLLVIPPREKSSTAYARSVLPEFVERKKVVKNSLFLARLLIGLEEQNPTLIASALEDEIVEPAREKAGILAGLSELKKIASEYGFGAAASGAGPTMIAVGQNKEEALEEKVKQLFEGVSLVWTTPSDQGVRRA